MKDTLVQLDIDSLAAGGAGIGRLEDGCVVFTHGGYPGDKAMVRIEKVKKRFAEGAVAKLVEPSPDRKESPCPYSAHCGGCPWISLDYQAQLRWKRKITEDSFARIAKMDVVVAEPIPSPETLGYRSRIRLKTVSVEGGARLGFRRARSHDIAPVDKCVVANEHVNRILGELKAKLAKMGTAAARYKEFEIEALGGKGRIIVHPGGMLGQKEVENLLIAVPSAEGLAVYYGGQLEEYGDTTITTPSLDGTELRVGAGAFSQVNAAANLKLVEKVVELSGLKPGKSGLDLYCGIGNFTIPLSMTGAAMTGADSSERAINAASDNRARLGIVNAHFTVEKAGDAAEQLAGSGLTFDTVIVDPPRGGAGALTVPASSLAKENIIYVSCDPPSLARDAAVLDKEGFELKSVTPVDMFPHTAHIEVAALFVRR